MIRHHDSRRASGRLVAMAVSLAVLIAAASRPATANPVVDLNVGLSKEMSQGLKAALLITATNAGSAFELGDVQLGLQLRPVGTVTGNLTIFSVNGLDAVWTSPTTTGPAPGTLTIAGNPPFPTSYSSISIVGGAFYPFEAGVAALANVEFEATNDAFGTWELYVVNELPNSGSPVSYFGDEDFNTFQFANLTVAQANPSQALKIGEVVVVPEPDTFLLGGLGLMLAGLGGWRRRVSAMQAV